jgi:hypothetical protein
VAQGIGPKFKPQYHKQTNKSYTMENLKDFLLESGVRKHQLSLLLDI